MPQFWEEWSEVQQTLVSRGLSILAVIVLALVARWLIHRAINRVVRTMTARHAGPENERPRSSSRGSRLFEQATGINHARHSQRVSTLGSLLRSVVTFVITLVTLLTIMAILGLPLGPLLASAGVGGIALGFGAQALVKDFLSGVFMIFEDQYGVGDVIDTGEATGTVEEVGLRVTRLRDANGVVWYIRNGEIIRIGNRSQGWSTATIDTSVSYAENAERVITLLREVGEQLAADPQWEDTLIEAPNVVGVESITGTTMTIRTIAKCVPNAHFGVQRELRERIKAALDAAGISPPPPLVGGTGTMGNP
ncbi:MAG: mechanosensitive ion channel family protein [Intrasporangiaceae bacterium]|nr:mechanosensitive ion channel family protein [Intrasporangiaceae bacterium]